MILFPGCKINLGLSVLRRRSDGYHDIESIMVPVGWTDVLEILPPSQPDVKLTCLGHNIDCPLEKNLVIKAYRELQREFEIGPVDIILEKIVPDGAGLGGGSADAAATIVGLNDFFSLNLSQTVMAQIASRIGADCPLFIYGRPMLATGTGTTLSPVELPHLKGLTLLIIKPDSVSISTAAAYAGIRPHEIESSVSETVALPVSRWQGLLVNDFESSIFPIAPEVKKIKDTLIRAGAVYASMSGSGSAVYGLFENRLDAQNTASQIPSYPHYLAQI